MKNLILITSLILLICCDNKKEANKYSDYIYNTLNFVSKDNEKEYFVILNPNTRCGSCYSGAINNVRRISNKYKITIVTNYDISRFISDTTLSKIIDDDNSICSANPSENFNSKFLIFKNKELIFERTITTLNTDSLEYYLINN